MEISGRRLVGPIEDLYRQVVSLRPNAPIEFQIVPPGNMPPGLAGTHTYTDPAGGSVIKFASDASDASVAVSLMYAALLRMGCPVLVARPDMPSWAEGVHSSLVDTILNPLVGNELREVGFDRGDHWAEVAAEVAGWEDPVPPLTESPALWIRAATVACMRVSMTGEANAALRNVQARYPEMWTISQEIADISAPDRVTSFTGCHRSLVRLIRCFYRNVLNKGGPDLRSTHPMGSSIVVTPRDLRKKASQIFDVRAMSGGNAHGMDYQAVVSKEDGLVCAITGIQRGAGADRLRRMRADLVLSVADFLGRYPCYNTIDEGQRISGFLRPVSLTASAVFPRMPVRMSGAKQRKPTGKLGPVKVTVGPGGSAEFEPIAFPVEKEEIESLIVRGFLGAVQNEPLADAWWGEVRQNPLDDFDFTVVSPSGTRGLELLEAVRMESRGGYESVPSSLRPYEFAEHVLSDIFRKARRYASSVGDGIVLLIYVTDWRFTPSNTFVALLQYWLSSQPHCFMRIYLYTPATAEEGALFTLFPTPASYWHNFDPEDFRENVVHNLDPESWRVTSEPLV